MSNVYVSQQPVPSMRGWVTILVTVTSFTTSTWCERYDSDYDNTFESYEDKSFQISKGQEKILRDYPHLKEDDIKKDRGHAVHKSSASSISLSSKDQSSEDSSSQSKRRHKKTPQPKENVWKNYARGKYGVEESVDLSILAKKKTVRSKVKDQTIKHVKTKQVQTTNSKDKSSIRKHEDEETSRKVYKKSREQKKEEKKLTEKTKKVTRKPSSERITEDEREHKGYDAKQRRHKIKELNNKLRKKIEQHAKKKENSERKESSSGSKTEEQMEFGTFSASHEKAKAESIDTSLRNKMKKMGKQKSGSKSTSKSESYVFSDSQLDLARGIPDYFQEKDMSKFIHLASSESVETTKTLKEEESSTKKEEEITKKVATKITVRKTGNTVTKTRKTKAKESWTDEEEDDYEDEGLEGQTYEGSGHHVKQTTKTSKTSEDRASDSSDYNTASGTREIKKKMRNLVNEESTDDNSLPNRRKLRKKDRKYMHHTTQKGKLNIKENPKKRPRHKLDPQKEHKEDHGFEEHTEKLTYTKGASSESGETEHTIPEGTRDPLDISTEELMRYHEVETDTKTTTTHSPTFELMKPTTLKPTGTDHWVCPSYVKSQTVEIHWSNYDERGEKRVKEKPIDAKFRNNMKKFSTRELKARLRDTQKRGQPKGMAPFDASAALKRVKFHEVFKIDPIDDDDIFRNVTYQPTCSREFEVRMLEKNYRQKYGRRMATAEEQREFAYMLNFIGNNSAALSEDTVRRIQDEEFDKMLACCDTQEVSSLMADFRDSAPQKIAYLKKMGRYPLTTSEEVSKLEREAKPEYQKRLRYQKTHRNKLKLKEGQKIEVLPGENKNIDPEYMAETEEEEEEEQATKNTALTYFPGGRYINTEELEGMKKENEYYERMRKIGGKITRMYDPNNTLSSAEWAALEATTMALTPRYRNPHRYTNPHHQPTSVRGRRKRSARERSRSKESIKTVMENDDPIARTQPELTKEKEQPENEETKVEEPPLSHTEVYNEHFMESSQDQWSSIRTNNSEISFDTLEGSKQENTTQVTDQRLSRVLDIMKKHKLTEKNKTELSWEKRMEFLFMGLTEGTLLPSDPASTVRSSKIENTPPDLEAEVLERTKRLKSNVNLTVSDELYRALGGPLPYSPNYWPASFLQSSGQLEHVQHEFGPKNVQEIKAMIKKTMYKLNRTEDSFERGMLTATVPVWRFWLGHTDPQKKLWGQYKGKLGVEDLNKMKIMDDIKKTLNETTKSKKLNVKKKVTADRVIQQNQNKYDDRSNEKGKRKRDRTRKFNDDSYEENLKRRNDRKSKVNQKSYEKKLKKRNERKREDSSEEKTKWKKERKAKYDNNKSKETPMKQKKKKPEVQKGERLNDGITPPKISRRDRAKRRDKTKYGSEYSDVMRDRKRKDRSSSSRSRERRDRNYRRHDSRDRNYRRYDDNRDRNYKRYDSRERRPREREIRGRRTGRRDDRRYEDRRYRDSRERRYDSRDRGRYDTKYRGRYDSRDKFESRQAPRKTNRIRKGRPERFKKKDRKKKRSKREVKKYVDTTTIDPVFLESRSEYQGKMVIDKEWVTRRRVYLAQKYARLAREEKERQLRKKGKLKEGQTISTRKPRVDYFDDKDLEQILKEKGLTKRTAFDSTGLDVEAYEKLENEYIKNKRRFHKHMSSQHSSDYLEKTKSVDYSLTEEEEMIKDTKRNRALKNTTKSITNNKKEINITGQTKSTPFVYTLGSHVDYIDVSKYNKAEADYMAEKNLTSSSSSGLSSYLESTDEDKDYVTDHNPDYGSQERMQKIEDNLVIDYKNKEVHFKNSPRRKFSKEDPKFTIPTWPTKRKNRFVRPQDRKLCYFNPSTTNRYRQALYIWHKYNQMKAAYERKENIDEIPSLDSDY